MAYLYFDDPSDVSSAIISYNTPPKPHIKVSSKECGTCYQGHVLHEFFSEDGIRLTFAECTPTSGVTLTDAGEQLLMNRV